MSRLFERFTEDARQVVVRAGEAAKELGHNYIGTEHLLLGLLHPDAGIAFQALESFDLDYDRGSSQVVLIVGRGEGQRPVEGRRHFTPRAKKALELTLREALRLGHNYMGPEHILLGLVRENEGVAARILLDFDADTQKVRNKVEHLLFSAGSRPSSQ